MQDVGRLCYLTEDTRLLNWNDKSNICNPLCCQMMYRWYFWVKLTGIFQYN